MGKAPLSRVLRRYWLALAIPCGLTLAFAQATPNRVHFDLQNYFASQIEPAYSNVTRFSFAVTGDIHLSRGSVFVLTKTQWQNLLGRWRDAGRLFGVIVGDLGYGALQDVDDVASGWAAVPNAPRIIYSMGNHEIDLPAGKRRWIDALYPNSVQASSWTPTVSSPGNSDRAYWSFDVGPYWRFVMLDADFANPTDGKDVQNRIGMDQLNWLNGDLQANRNRNVMVFVHEPIAQAQYDTPYYTLYDRGALMDILKAHPKQKFVFSGHLHSYRGVTKWRGITSVHTSEVSSNADGVTVSIDGETASVSWAGMTPSNVVDYDQYPMYAIQRVGNDNVLRVGEEGGDYGQTRLQKMAVVGAQNGVTPTFGSLMLKGGPINWYDSWFISEQLVKIVPGMKFLYDIQLLSVTPGKDAVAVQPNWVMLDGRPVPVVVDQNGIRLSTRPRDGSTNLYYDDLPVLGGRATGRWYHRDIDLTPLAGHYADGIHLVARALAAEVGTIYVDNIQFRWPAGTCSGTLTPTSSAIGAAGGTGTVSVAAAAECTWTAESSVPWVAIAGGASGIGSGTVSYSVQPNAFTTARSGTLTIAGQMFTITQGASLPDTTPPAILSRTPSAGAVSVPVTTTVAVRFTEAMAAASIGATSVRLRANGATSDVPAAVTLSGDLATLTPLQPLAAPTTYHVTVAGTVTDLAGNAMGADATWSFTTSVSVPVTIGINFVGTASSMGAGEIAGVVPKANWNNATGATRSTPLALKDETGAPSTSTVTWRADNTWSTPITDTPGNRRLMKGYLDNGYGAVTTVTVAGLPAGTYDVYVYVDGDGGGSRTGSYQISGAGITTTTINLTDPGNTNFDATFTQANSSTGNYVKFSISASSFTLTATPGPTSDGTPRAPVNGIQIVSAAPPPPSVPDFTIAASPSSRTVTPGSGSSYTVTIGAVSGFASTVNLAVSGLPANATGSFTPASVTGWGSATLNVTTAANTPTGTSTLTLTGTSGSLVHTAAVALKVTTASSNAISINFVGRGTSMSATESAGVVARPNWNNATGATRSTPLALKDEAGGATGATVVWTSDNVWSTPIADQAGNARLMKGYLDTGFENASTVTVAGLPTADYDVYVYADGDNGSGTRTGAYQISGAGVTTTTINLTDTAATNFNATFVQASNSNGNYVKFNVKASDFTLTATPGPTSDSIRRAPVNGIQIVPTASPPPPSPDFTIAATPSSRTITQGNSTSYTVTVGALNGFAGTVSLGVSGLPANATASFSPAAVTGSVSAILTVTTAATTPAGSSTLTIMGTSGSLSHTTMVSLVTVP